MERYKTHAIKALFVNYDEIVQALIDISSYETQSDDTRSDAFWLESKMNKLENTLVNFMEYYFGTFQLHHLIFTERWRQSHNCCDLVQNIFLAIMY